MIEIIKNEIGWLAVCAIACVVIGWALFAKVILILIGYWRLNK